MLEDKWNISKKEVFVAHPYFFFKKEENIKITPLKNANKRGTSGAIWAKAYQAVKHDRSKNLKEGTLRDFIRALAALYILNIYYNGDDDLKEIKDLSLGSDIFSVSSSKQGCLFPDGNYEKAQAKYICIEKRKDEMQLQIEIASKEDLNIYKKLLANSEEFKEYFKKNLMLNFKMAKAF